MSALTETTDTVEDFFLGGRVKLLQPTSGYRAATDPVLLAASVPVSAGDEVLDLGCGAGAASLCLAARVKGLDLHGIELQSKYAELARKNARRNQASFAVHQGDIRAMPDALKERVFDAVMLNPPWHGAEGSGSPDKARDVAHRLDTTLAVWLAAASSRTRPGGSITLIQRAEWLPDILQAMATRCGDITVLPLAAREGRDAKRVIVKGRKGSRGPFRLAAPFVLHEGAAHVRDADDFTSKARAVLRDASALDF